MLKEKTMNSWAFRMDILQQCCSRGLCRKLPVNCAGKLVRSVVIRCYMIMQSIREERSGNRLEAGLQGDPPITLLIIKY
jgi:hypothetical protein